jgi:hypothetical protein
MLEIYNNFQPDEALRQHCIMYPQFYSLISDERQTSKANYNPIRLLSMTPFMWFIIILQSFGRNEILQIQNLSFHLLGLCRIR